MKILIIGNGSIGNYQSKEYFINNHTGIFLQEIGRLHKVLFVQYIVPHNPNNDLQNFEMKQNQIAFSGINNLKNPTTIVQLFNFVRHHDFIYLFFPGTLSRIGAIMAIMLGKKYALYIRGQLYNQYKFDKIILKKTSFILTVSPLFVSDLNSYCKRVEIIKPMISLTTEDTYFNRDYKKSNKWNILFVGRIEYRKGIHELVQIAHYLKSKHLNFEMNLVGGGDLFNATREHVKEQELDDCIILHGQISDKLNLMNFYSRADIFVFPSHDEGFPRVLYEAMAKALPIFTTFVGGIPGRMKNNINCIEIPRKNGTKAARIIYESLHNCKLLQKVGINGRDTLLKILDGTHIPHEVLFLKMLKNE